MGLDVSSYRKCDLIRTRASGEPYDEALGEGENVVSIHHWDETALPKEDRLDGRVPGYYRWGEEFFCLPGNGFGHLTYGGFRAGSYGGYNRWREWLCRRALNVEPEEVWANPDRYRDQPFYALINFSDAGGAIGPETSAHLAADFERWRQRICDGQDQYDVDLYDTFAAAFDFASDGGFVVFH